MVVLDYEAKKRPQIFSDFVVKIRQKSRVFKSSF